MQPAGQERIRFGVHGLVEVDPVLCQQRLQTAFLERIESLGTPSDMFPADEQLWNRGRRSLRTHGRPHLAKIIDRLGDFGAAIADAQIKAADGKLSGMYVWGDIAYVNGMMFSPKYWHDVYKPQLQKITDVIHGHAGAD